MTNKKTLADLRRIAHGKYFVFAWSPGDRVTRYRFFNPVESHSDQDYFGPTQPEYTALGAKEAWEFLGHKPSRGRR